MTNELTPAMKAAMRELGSRGGKKAAAKMTKAERVARATKASRAAAAKRRGVKKGN